MPNVFLENPICYSFINKINEISHIIPLKKDLILYKCHLEIEQKLEQVRLSNTWWKKLAQLYCSLSLSVCSILNSCLDLDTGQVWLVKSSRNNIILRLKQWYVWWQLMHTYVFIKRSVIPWYEKDFILFVIGNEKGEENL